MENLSLLTQLMNRSNFRPYKDEGPPKGSPSESVNALIGDRLVKTQYNVPRATNKPFQRNKPIPALICVNFQWRGEWAVIMSYLNSGITAILEQSLAVAPIQGGRIAERRPVWSIICQGVKRTVKPSQALGTAPYLLGYLLIVLIGLLVSICPKIDTHHICLLRTR